VVRKGRCEMDLSSPPRLLDGVRDFVRVKRCSLRTEQAYLD
jgi:hypothetical protein